MKKRFATIFMVMVMMFALCGCNNSTVQSERDMSDDSSSMFVLIEHTNSWNIVYHKDTKVMYAVSASSYNYGTFTLLVDENGNPMLWDK